MKNLYLFAAVLCAPALLSAQLSLQQVSIYSSGLFDESAAEIVTYDKMSKKLFFSNAAGNSVGIIDFTDPTSLSLESAIDLSIYGGGVNSVSAFNGVIAVAVQGISTATRGKVVFFDSDGTYIADVEAGYLPDMVTFSHDGKMVIVANEGEPNDDWTEDPDGSVSIIDVSGGIASVAQSNVTELVIGDYTGSWDGVRVFGPDSNQDVASNMEPEYVAISEDNSKAFISLQENNAIAVIDLTTKTITDIQALGYKDHSLSANGLDASDKDDTINITTYPFRGLYLPDAITTIDINGTTYYLTANEGDSRDYDGYSEEVRLEDLDLDSATFPNAEDLQEDEAGGRMKVTTSMGDTDNDGDYDEIYTYGARSFSIWSASGTLVFDSGDDFEQKLAAEEADNFNSTNDENDSFDNRSDDKGPEPEAIEVAWINDEPYAFIGMERIGGIMMYNISNPAAPTFVQYINNRDFTVDADTEEAGDLGCEDVLFIDGIHTADSNFYIVTSNEVSGTVSVFQILGAEIPEDTTSGEPNGIEAQFGFNDFSFFPNPASTMLSFSSKDAYRVYDLAGQLVVSTPNVSKVNVAPLEKGIYLIRNSKGSSKVFVKE
tara:strand:- start:395 stop:2200 length:1806 start_codon:yes stop_codon:yes gene_type:complete